MSVSLYQTCMSAGQEVIISLESTLHMELPLSCSKTNLSSYVLKISRLAGSSLSQTLISQQIRKENISTVDEQRKLLQ